MGSDLKSDVLIYKNMFENATAARTMNEVYGSDCTAFS